MLVRIVYKTDQIIMQRNFNKYYFPAGLVLILISSIAYGQSNRLISFSLQDQFDVTYTETQYRDYFVILVAGDRKGSDYSFPWSDFIKDELKRNSMTKEVKVLGVANLKTAPTSLRNFIKGKFPKEKKHWVMLDWEGLFDEAYLFKEDVANILIFDPDGNKIYSTTVTETDEPKLNTLISVIKKHSSG